MHVLYSLVQFRVGILGDDPIDRKPSLLPELDQGGDELNLQISTSLNEQPLGEKIIENSLFAAQKTPDRIQRS